jgi:hypothetical protein
MFVSEDDLTTQLDYHDALIANCIHGDMSFEEFLDRYNDFYPRAALDGHESDAEERQLLAGAEHRIALHRAIWDEILTKLCDDAMSEHPQAKKAGFFGHRDGFRKLQALADCYLNVSS